MTATPAAPVSTTIARPDYPLADSLWVRGGTLLLIGTQALLRLLLMMRQEDADAGLGGGGRLCGRQPHRPAGDRCGAGAGGHRQRRQGPCRPDGGAAPPGDHARHAPALDRHEHVRDFTAPDLHSNAGCSVKRQPYFCAGCPHNISTRVPEGSTAWAGIGCHFMANGMDRSTAGLIQMGGEGVDWVSHAMFTKVPHVLQNLGNGTYYHSGYLAIRQAVAAQATLTYKILYNDAVAMTGGQPVDGVISVDAIARQVESEGVKQVVVRSDDIAKYDAIRGRFPAGAVGLPGVRRPPRSPAAGSGGRRRPATTPVRMPLRAA